MREALFVHPEARIDSRALMVGSTEVFTVGHDSNATIRPRTGIHTAWIPQPLGCRAAHFGPGPRSRGSPEGSALMFPSSCLDGVITRAGPGQHTHSTPVPSTEGRLWVARHSNTAPLKNEPKFRHGSGAMVEHSSAVSQV